MRCWRKKQLFYHETFLPLCFLRRNRKIIFSFVQSLLFTDNFVFTIFGAMRFCWCFYTLEQIFECKWIRFLMVYILTWFFNAKSFSLCVKIIFRKLFLDFKKSFDQKKLNISFSMKSFLCKWNLHVVCYPFIC